MKNNMISNILWFALSIGAVTITNTTDIPARLKKNLNVFLKVKNGTDVEKFYSYHNKNGDDVTGILLAGNTVIIDLNTVDLSKGELFGIKSAQYDTFKDTYAVNFGNRWYRNELGKYSNLAVLVNLKDNESESSLHIEKLDAPIEQ